jgi:hypothetical protein
MKIESEVAMCDRMQMYNIMKIVFIGSSEMLVPIYHSTQCHIPEYSNLQTAVRTSNITCEIGGLLHVDGGI